MPAFATAGFRREALEQAPSRHPPGTRADFLAQADTFRPADTTMRGLTEEEFLRGKERLHQAAPRSREGAPPDPRVSWLDLLVLR